MKKIIFILLMGLILGSCARMIATTADVAEKSTSTIRTVDQIRTDLEIKRNLKKLINNTTIANIEYCNFNVINQSVLVACVVENEVAKKKIFEKILNLKNIVEVLDEVSIEPMINKNYFRDFWLKQAIELKIFVKTSIKSINYDLTIINGNVYIVGIARDQKELESVTKSIATVNGVKEVNSYISLQNENDKNFNNKEKI